MTLSKYILVLVLLTLLCYANGMHETNDAAVAELRTLIKERDITPAQISRRAGRNEMWVSRKLNGVSSLTIDDYGLLKQTIEQVPVNALVSK